MEKFRKIKFQYFVLLYSLCLIVVFILVALVLILNIKIDIPEQLRGYYVSADEVVFTENGLLIPLNELEKSVVTEQEIHSLFIPYYVSIITRTTLTAFAISLILSFVFAYILTGRIIKPIEELFDIESAFLDVKAEISRLYADFENLSSFISHEQKNSLALLRAVIQNECPAVAERTTAQLDRIVKSLDDKNFYASGGWESMGFADSTDAQSGNVQRQAPNTVVLGYSDHSLMEDFAQGLRELDEGSFFKSSGECMVSRDFADLNGLKPGDHLELQDVNNTEVDPLHLTVCGIYLDITTPQPNGGDWALNNRRNEILTGFSTLEEHSTFGLYVTAVYYLKNPGLAADFERYVRENGLHEVYNVNVDAESYNRIVKPVESLKSISTAFLMVILLVGCLILILLSMLGVRERKYEIGVLRAIGMPKAKITIGLICESVCVMVLCLCIGLGVGGLIAQPVSNRIMEEQADLAEQRPQADYGDIISSTAGVNETASVLCCP